MIPQTLRLLEEGQNITTTTEENIICEQYGDSLVSINNEYLANFKCSMEFEENQELLSIEPTKMEIMDKDYNKIQEFETEKKSLAFRNFILAFCIY